MPYYYVLLKKNTKRSVFEILAPHKI